MKKILCTNLVIHLSFLFISGQYYENLYDEYMAARRSNLSFLNHVVGSPYENPEFLEAEVFMNGSSNPVKVRLRYNNLFHEMEMKQNNSDQFLLVENKEEIDSICFYIINEKFRFMTYKEKEKINKGYFIQVYQDDCSLFLRQTREYKPEKVPSGYSEYVPPSIVRIPDVFYVQFGNTPLQQIPQSTKKTEILFKENGYDISPCLKKQKFKYDITSLKEIIIYCNK